MLVSLQGETVCEYESANQIIGISYSPFGTLVALAESDIVTILDGDTCELRDQRPGSYGENSVSFLDDDRLVVAATDRLLIWDQSTGEVIESATLAQFRSE